jgi:hypothetical protein
MPETIVPAFAFAVVSKIKTAMFFRILENDHWSETNMSQMK